MAKQTQPLEGGPKDTAFVLELFCSLLEGCARLTFFKPMLVRGMSFASLMIKTIYISGYNPS
jgi:hypothetical protein